MQNAPMNTYDSVHSAKSFFWNCAKRESLKKIWRKVQMSSAAACDVPTSVVPCEKPTPTGWSMYSL